MQFDSTYRSGELNLMPVKVGTRSGLAWMRARRWSQLSTGRGKKGEEGVTSLGRQ
jgi:hypothetical protein